MYADEISKKIEAVKKEIHDTPYDKSSQFHHGVLKAKLAKYNDMLEAKVAMVVVARAVGVTPSNIRVMHQ